MDAFTCANTGDDVFAASAASSVDLHMLYPPPGKVSIVQLPLVELVALDEEEAGLLLETATELLELAGLELLEIIDEATDELAPPVHAPTSVQASCHAVPVPGA